MLIASKDDSRHVQLRVTSNGVAYLSDSIGNIDDDNIAFKLETWLSGNDYTGNVASCDTEHIERVERVLRENWPKPKSSFIDYY